MGYAWAPQITGLVRGEPKPGQRHRSNGKAILMECSEERASKSPTLDRSQSGRNTYTHARQGEVSGSACWEAMCDEADAYRSKVTLKDGRTAERGLRHDAVIGWAMIIKPPPEMVAELGMTDDDIQRFCDDGLDAMSEIEPRLFRRRNVQLTARHKDEDSDHVHVIGVSKDDKGKYCGNLIDAALCIRINQQWPQKMRDLGWPIDDLDLTDWDRMQTDEAYKAERTAKANRQGRSVSQYAKDRAAKAGKAATRIITDAQDAASQIVKDAKAEALLITAAAKRDAKAEATRLDKLQQAVKAAEDDLQDIEGYKAYKAEKAAQKAAEDAKRAQGGSQVKDRRGGGQKAVKRTQAMDEVRSIADRPMTGDEAAAELMRSIDL